MIRSRKSGNEPLASSSSSVTPSLLQSINSGNSTTPAGGIVSNRKPLSKQAVIWVLFLVFVWVVALLVLTSRWALLFQRQESENRQFFTSKSGKMFRRTGNGNVFNASMMQHQEDEVHLGGFASDEINNAEMDHEVPLSQRMTPYELWVHGHWLFIPHTQHGETRVLNIIDSYNGEKNEDEREGNETSNSRRRMRTVGVKIDAVVLDAFWWEKAAKGGNANPSFLDWNHLLYPNPFRFRQELYKRNVKLILWLSGIIPTHSQEYGEGVAMQCFIKDYGKQVQSSKTAPVWNAVWDHVGFPLSGGLIDIMNPVARTWLRSSLQMFIATYGIDGIRLGGVDALLLGKERSLLSPHEGYFNREEYRHLYYEFFLGAGRSVRGTDFVVFARAVDSFGDYAFEEFAPVDVNFAGFVGDHPFTFQGMRESMMNVLHSAQKGYFNFGTMMGGSVAVRDEQLKSHLEKKNPRLPHLNRERKNEEDDALEHSYLENKGFCRKRELFVRWVQISALLPLMCNGGLPTLHSPTYYDRFLEDQQTSLSPEEHCDVRGAENNPAARVQVTDLYKAAVIIHRFFSPYFLTLSTQSFYHYYQKTREVALQARRPNSSSTQNTPAAAEKFWQQILHLVPTEENSEEEQVLFQEPLSWNYQIGSSLFVAPVLWSFGRVVTSFPVQFPNNAIHLQQQSAAEDLGKQETSYWIHLSSPQRVFSGGESIEFSTPSLLEEPLYFVRCGDIVPAWIEVSLGPDDTSPPEGVGQATEIREGFLVFHVFNPLHQIEAGSVRKATSEFHLPYSLQWQGMTVRYNIAPVFTEHQASTGHYRLAVEMAPASTFSPFFGNSSMSTYENREQDNEDTHGAEEKANDETNSNGEDGIVAGFALLYLTRVRASSVVRCQCEEQGAADGGTFSACEEIKRRPNFGVDVEKETSAVKHFDHEIQHFEKDWEQLLAEARNPGAEHHFLRLHAAHCRVINLQHHEGQEEGFFHLLIHQSSGNCKCRW